MTKREALKDLQNRLAASFGLVDNKQKRASEQLMQRYGT